MNGGGKVMEFEQIYNAYFKSVYHYIRKLSGDEYIAEEITSETFLKVMKSIGDFRGECDMRVWICQIAKNTYYSYLKKSKRIASVDETEMQSIEDPNIFIEEQIGIRDETQQIRKILHTMPEPYKEIFMWRVFGELSFKEIGELYNKTDNWACVTYHRARKIMQSRLEEINNEKRV
ncbi:MAG: sigma-70 family RNA polymerase sigma factor [Lachnospiraceae bacterium]|nr:sigma-70 family RNA polymerase sigma factor [Lachnospiraceae bacterium]